MCFLLVLRSKGEETTQASSVRALSLHEPEAAASEGKPQVARTQRETTLIKQPKARQAAGDPDGEEGKGSLRTGQQLTLKRPNQVTYLDYNSQNPGFWEL